MKYLKRFSHSKVQQKKIGVAFHYANNCGFLLKINKISTINYENTPKFARRLENYKNFSCKITYTIV